MSKQELKELRDTIIVKGSVITILVTEIVLFMQLIKFLTEIHFW